MWRSWTGPRLSRLNMRGSEAAILNQVSPTDAESPLQPERYFKGGSLTGQTQLDMFEQAKKDGADDNWQNLIVQGDNLQFLKTCSRNADPLIKDRVKRSFNPDFFIKMDLAEYISGIESDGNPSHLEKLKKLQDDGIESLIKVVEIKSDEEQDEATPAKEEYARAHFERVNEKLSTVNLADIESQYRADAKQYYTCDLLTPHQFSRWIADLKKGNMG